MLEKILSIKNFINVWDEYGKLSWTQIAASAVQLAIAVLVVWAAVQLGIWDQFYSFFFPGE